MADKKKEEAAVETMLNHMHKHHISLHEDAMKTYGDHFRKVLLQLIVLMKEEDALFKAIYSRDSGAGSYYDGLKVGKPEEFDMDIVIRLPFNYEEITIVNTGNVPAAFTKVKITKPLDSLRQHPEWSSTYRSMDKWRDKDGFLLQSEFRQWVEGVVNKALNRLDKKERNCYELKIKDPVPSGRMSKYYISLKKSGPAMTFTITILPDDVKVDVDFVPVIEFTHPKWPAKPVRPLSDQLIKAKRTSWFIVPKPKKTGDPDSTLWRLAFHEQERELINDKGQLKPVCRLLKMLKVLEQNLERGGIKYYWDKRCDLTGFQQMHRTNLVGRLRKIIADIEKNVSESPLVIAKYILSSVEFKDFEKNFPTATIPLPSKPTAAVADSAKERAVVRTPDLEAFRHTSHLHCSVCVDISSKLDNIVSLLTALHLRVERLQDRVSALCADTTSL